VTRGCVSRNLESSLVEVTLILLFADTSLPLCRPTSLHPVLFKGGIVPCIYEVTFQEFHRELISILVPDVQWHGPNLTEFDARSLDSLSSNFWGFKIMLNVVYNSKLCLHVLKQALIYYKILVNSVRTM
jgi:hypothetical protein